MKKLLSVLMVASMVSFVACKGGKKDDEAKRVADSTEEARVKDSATEAEKAKMTTPVDTAAKVDTAATKEAPKKGAMHKDGDHK